VYQGYILLGHDDLQLGKMGTNTSQKYAPSPDVCIRRNELGFNSCIARFIWEHGVSNHNGRHCIMLEHK
jgi:hypothetical protein